MSPKQTGSSQDNKWPPLHFCVVLGEVMVATLEMGTHHTHIYVPGIGFKLLLSSGQEVTLATKWPCIVAINSLKCFCQTDDTYSL